MIVSYNDLAEVRSKHKDKTIVLGSGVFDLLHKGHVKYIEAIKKHGEFVVIMVKSDDRVRLGKGPDRPILPEEDRVAMIDALKGVDIAFIAPHLGTSTNYTVDATYEAVFKVLKPDAFYTTNPVWKMLEKLGGPKIIIEDRADVKLSSTTAIIDHIKRNN